MWVRVDQWLVNMCMRMRFAPIPFECVLVAMVLIVMVRVRMFLALVGVQMRVTLRDVQPDASSHQQARQNELPRHGVPIERDRQRRPKEGRDRGSGSRGEGSRDRPGGAPALSSGAVLR